MAIYTGAGDGGKTIWPGRRELLKSDARIAALGALDELNAAIGSCLAAAESSAGAEVRQALEPLQGELLAAGAMMLATWTGTKPQTQLQEAAVGRMEKHIDRLWDSLPHLESFLLPGGCELACRLHVARAVCRRTERQLVATAEDPPGRMHLVLKYLNRLSDLLFTLARAANRDAGAAERPWRQQG